jgi:hypothetical protein
VTWVQLFGFDPDDKGMQALDILETCDTPAEMQTTLPAFSGYSKPCLIELPTIALELGW